jgi:hypothetical protein
MAEEETAVVRLADVGHIEKARTDAMRAQEIRDQLAPLLAQVCAILNQARADGLIVSFNLGLDMYGRSRVQDMSIVRPL